VSFKLADLVMTNMDRLPLFIRMGSFDQVLVRPLSTLGQVITGDFDVRQLGGSVQGALVFVFALTRVHIDWTVARLVILASMIVSGFVIFSALFVTTNAIAFWIMDAREVANTFTYGGNFLTQHPLNVYAAWMRRFFGYAATLAFVNYFPTLYILEKADPLHAPRVLRFASPVAAALIGSLAWAVWRLAVRHYRSTGS
jgi:ABC-2 type transport system permease protein